MTADVDIDRVLAAVAATLNDQRLEQFDTDRVQSIVTKALGGQGRLTVDDGGGMHDASGTRVGAIRRTPSGEWITEPQNAAAERSDAAVPSPQPQGKVRKLLTRLNLLAG